LVQDKIFPLFLSSFIVEKESSTREDSDSQYLMLRHYAIILDSIENSAYFLKALDFGLKSLISILSPTHLTVSSISQMIAYCFLVPKNYPQNLQFIDNNIL